MSDLEEKILKCWEDKDFDYTDVTPLYKEFNDLFSISKIKSFSPDECLDKLFGRVSDNSLVYNIELPKC